MTRTSLRTLPILLVAFLPLGAVLAESVVTVQGEAGTPVDAYCASDSEVMGTTSNAMFFPESGCVATYNVGGPRTVLVVTYTNGGVGATATVCGHFEFSGASVGATSTDCTYSDANRAVIATATTVAGTGATLYVEWVAGSGTPSYANAYLDSFTVS